MVEYYNTYNIAGHWLAPLLNDDVTGLADGEEEQLDKWEKELPLPVTYAVKSEESVFALDDVSGLMADCYEVDIWIQSEK